MSSARTGKALGNTNTLGYHHTDEARAKIGAASRGKSHATWAPWSPESIKRRADANRGKRRSAEFCAETSRRAAAQLLAGRCALGHQRAPFTDRSGRHWLMRSPWEARFAERLDAWGLTWVYEPTALLLTTGRHYIPDFWVAEWQAFVEIRIFLARRGTEKLAQAQRDGHRVISLVGQEQFEAFLAFSEPVAA